MRARALSMSLPADRSAAFAVVVLFHIALGYAFYSGLTTTFIRAIVGDVIVRQVPAAQRPDIALPSTRVDFAPVPVLDPEVPTGTIESEDGPTVTTHPPAGGPASSTLEPGKAPLITAARMDPRHPITVNRGSYPDSEIRAGHEGRCVVNLGVAADGRIIDASLQTRTGFEKLDAACLEAVRGQRMLPATQDGKPVAGRAAIPIVWKIDPR
jgi:periplasmic protein TonB